MPVMETFEKKAKEINDILADLTPIERIKWVGKKFKSGIVATTSGGRTSRVIPALVQKALGGSVPTIFVDTGHYSKETYIFVDRMQSEGVDIRYYQASMSIKRMQALHGDLWLSKDKKFEKFLDITKHEPLNRAFRELGATVWVRGIMGFQTSERSKSHIFEYKNGLYRLHPIIDWTHKQAQNYIEENGLPVNPHHFDITKGLQGKLECKIGEKGGFKQGEGI